MTQEGLILVHDAEEERAKGLIAALYGEGKNVSGLCGGQKRALDAGREEFYRLCQNGARPVVAGYGTGAALALAIAQVCPVSGVICVCPAYGARSAAERRLARSVMRDLFLIVAPVILAVSSFPSALAARIIDQISTDDVRVIQLGDEEIWSQAALSAILKQLHNIRDTKALVLRQILRL